MHIRAVGDKPARVCGRLVRSQSLDLIPFMRDVRRGMKSFAVELPYVEFGVALCVLEGVTKASERSFSAANWL